MATAWRSGAPATASSRSETPKTHTDPSLPSPWPGGYAFTSSIKDGESHPDLPALGTYEVSRTGHDLKSRLSRAGADPYRETLKQQIAHGPQHRSSARAGRVSGLNVRKLGHDAVFRASALLSTERYSVSVALYTDV